MQQDRIKFGGGAGDSSSDSDDLDGSEEEEGVMNLDGAGGGSSDDDDDDDSEEDDSDASELPELPEHVRRAAMQASSEDDDDESDGDGDGPGGGKFGAGGWGKNRSSYYNADTADLEIGQEFEDAEAEEEAALELQRASYKRLDPADYGEEEEEEGEEASETAKQEGGGKGKGKTAAKRRERDGTSSAAGAQGEALRAMKSDLEQIALGAGGEVETSVVKRDTSKLSRRDKLELVLSEAPELPALLGEVRAQLGTLTESVQPLVSNVTAEIGASKDGLVYLRTRQQLLLAYCMNVCFYMVLKAKGEPAKGHPVVRRLLSLRGLLEDMSALDDKMSSQVDLLLRALRSGVDLAGGSDNEEEEEEGQSDGGTGVSAANGRGKARVAANEGSVGSSAQEEGEDVDEEGLEEEEARFMGGVGGGGGSSSSSSDEEEDGGTGEPRESSKDSKKKKKKRRRAAREKAVEEARAKLAAGADGTGDALLGDFGDEDMDERPAASGGGGGNLLQGMVNRISQRDQAATARKGRGLQGDLDVPVRERDQTIRVRRPAPGEDSDVEDGGSADSEDDDFLGGGGGGFMDGLPPGLLEGLSRSGGGGDGRKTKKKEGKRGRDGGGKGAAEDEEDGFYASVAEEKERKKRAKKDKYEPQARIAGALEAELEAERAARGETKRGASYTIIKNRGLTPHKNKLNRNPRSKKREAFRKATIRRKGQVRDIRTGEADAYGGESTGIKSNVTRSRKLKG
ncbi:unnamed protein product [Ectocarpus fasciculatus]